MFMHHFLYEICAEWAQTLMAQGFHGMYGISEPPKPKSPFSLVFLTGSIFK